MPGLRGDNGASGAGIGMMLIEARDISVSLGGAEVLSQVSMGLTAGEIVTILGPNGSGKSTLLRALLGIVPLTSGRVERAAGLRIGYVPQRLAIDASLPITVRRFLSLPHRVSDAGAAAVLVRVGLEGIGHRQLASLSGGQLQRVLLALALEPSPELLLLDEPASGIDFKSQHGFYEMISEINRRTGVTILLVSHDLTVVSRFAHHVLCLRDGVIQCQGKPEEILNPKTLADTFGPEMRLFAHAHA